MNKKKKKDRETLIGIKVNEKTQKMKPVIVYSL